MDFGVGQQEYEKFYEKIIIYLLVRNVYTYFGQIGRFLVVVRCRCRWVHTEGLA